MNTDYKRQNGSCYAVVPLDSALKGIELHCRRKRQFIQFFLAAENLPAQLRYESVLRCWRKIGSMWESAQGELKLELHEGQLPQRIIERKQNVTIKQETFKS